MHAWAPRHVHAGGCAGPQDDKGGSKGFGFVNFKENDAAAKCVDTLNEKDVKGKILYAGRAQKKSEREALLRKKLEDSKAERIAKYQGMNLYVKNVHDEMTDDELREMFNAAGTITSCKVRAGVQGCSGACAPSRVVLHAFTPHPQFMSACSFVSACEG